jgi:hypothetical protein
MTTRQLTLHQPSGGAETITDAALRLFNQTWPEQGKAASIMLAPRGGVPPWRTSRGPTMASGACRPAPLA